MCIHIHIYIYIYVYVHDDTYICKHSAAQDMDMKLTDVANIVYNHILLITNIPPPRRWSSNPSGKCSYGRPTRGTVCGTMRSMCDTDAGCSAMNYQSLSLSSRMEQNEFYPNQVVTVWQRHRSRLRKHMVGGSDVTIVRNDTEQCATESAAVPQFLHDLHLIVHSTTASPTHHYLAQERAEVRGRSTFSLKGCLFAYRDTSLITKSPPRPLEPREDPRYSPTEGF